MAIFDLPTATVGGKINAADFNKFRDAWKLPHAEFTATSASTASATLASMGTLSNDATRSNDTTFVTASTNTLTVANAGLYSISANGTLPSAPSGVCYLRVDTSVGFAETYLNNATSTSRIWGGTFFASIYLPASSVLTFQFYHTSAAARVLTTRIAVTAQGLFS